MKISEEQRRAIIKEAIVTLKSGEQPFLCCALSAAIGSILSVKFLRSSKFIRKYIPEFKQSTAIEYFYGCGDFAWWGIQRKDKKSRLRFLRYLLTGKLPNKKTAKR